MSRRIAARLRPLRIRAKHSAVRPLVAGVACVSELPKGRAEVPLTYRQRPAVGWHILHLCHLGTLHLCHVGTSFVPCTKGTQQGRRIRHETFCHSRKLGGTSSPR